MKKNKKRLTKFGIITISGVIICAMLWQLFANQIRTEPAVFIDQNDSFITSGWFFRDEINAPAVPGDTVQHIVQSGEKVQKNAALAISYQSEQALETSQQVAMLSQQAELLQNAVQTMNSISDTGKTETMITAQIANLASQIEGGVVSGSESDIKELRRLCLRRGISDMEMSELTARTEEITAELTYLESQIEGKSSIIASPASGFFSEVVDGFEDTLTLDALSTMTVNSLLELNPDDINTDGNQNQLGKIIQGFHWYFAAAVPVSEIESLEVGDSIYFRFTQIPNDIPVKIEDIRKEKNSDTALLVVSSMEITPELVSMRYQTVEVIRANYKGIRVPKSAVRIQENDKGEAVQGVYILAGSLSRFKTIEVLYETDTYFVVKQGTTEQNTGLVVGDNIITKAKGLEDMRVIQ